ncbi:MAG: D-glycero-beta-D-manno-heptose 1-phosphate adenylyltransferase [Cyclobacteriaceae bacterium]
MSTKHKICCSEEINERILPWRKEGDIIVFTNGCFDLLHLGHIDYLEKAKQLGDRLIVGVNSDESVTELKGEGRPINKAFARLRMLAALEFVDMVISFSEATPSSLIMEVKPDILVKGKDYEIGNIVGADFVMQNGGRVVTIELIEGYSTTEIIKKING